MKKTIIIFFLLIATVLTGCNNSATQYDSLNVPFSEYSESEFNENDKIIKIYPSVMTMQYFLYGDTPDGMLDELGWEKCTLYLNVTDVNDIKYYEKYNNSLLNYETWCKLYGEQIDNLSDLLTFEEGTVIDLVALTSDSGKLNRCIYFYNQIRTTLNGEGDIYIYLDCSKKDYVYIFDHENNKDYLVPHSTYLEKLQQSQIWEKYGVFCITPLLNEYEISLTAEI